MVTTAYPPDLAPDEFAFQRRYGPWAAFTPDEARDIFEPIGIDWWIAGGYAVEAFTDAHRDHEDIDVSIFRRDVPALTAALDGRFHLWSVGSGSLRPVDERFPEPAADADQIWLREHALSPWRADVVLNRDDGDGRWVSRRDPSFVAPLDDVTWWCGGIRHLRPEIALAFKAKLRRPKDERDFSVTLPLLAEPAREWLADYLARLEPDHPWRQRL